MNYRSILSPLSKTNRFYIEPSQVCKTYRKTYTIFGDNDLDFSFLLLSQNLRTEVVVASQNNLYYNFWNTLSKIGADEFCDFFVSQMQLYLEMPYESLLYEMAQLGTTNSLMSFFTLCNITNNGTPFGVVKDTTIEKITLSLIKLKKLKNLLDRISFEEFNDNNGVYFCMNEIERNFSNRDADILSFKLEDTNSLGTILCNLPFDGSKQKSDKFGNKFYSNV